MKKVLIGLFLIVASSTFSANQVIELKGGVDFGGKYDIDDIWYGGNAKTGLEVGAEYRYKVYPGVELGAGLAFQSHKKLKHGGEGFDSLPVYATMKYSFDTGSVEPYVKAALEAQKVGLGLNAGHDLSLDNLKYFKEHIPNLLEVSIGHALICEALYLGLENVIQLYLNKLAD